MSENEDFGSYGHFCPQGGHPGGYQNKNSTSRKLAECGIVGKNTKR